MTFHLSGDNKHDAPEGIKFIESFFPKINTICLWIGRMKITKSEDLLYDKDLYLLFHKMQSQETVEVQ